MERKVPQFAPYLDDREYAAIKSCFELNWITEGPQSKLFLERLLELTGAPYGAFAPNGTLAIYLALRAVGIGPGDEVVVPDFTFMGSATAVEMTGATPVFCDINPETLQVEARHFAQALGPRTRALMPVHIYGMACEMDPIMALARERALLVVEDAAQAIDVRYRGRHAGTFGDAGCFSFFADKTITTGEGGLIVTSRPEVHQSLLYLRNQGRINRGSFIHPQIGYNFRMTDIQAAIGLVQLSKLEEIKARKATLLERYRRRLGDLPQVRFLRVPEGSELVPFRVGIYVERMEALVAHLQTKNIETRSFFYPLHRQPAFQYLREDPQQAPRLDEALFPGAVYAYENGICLPSYPALALEDLDYICETIRSFYGR